MRHSATTKYAAAAISSGSSSRADVELHVQRRGRAQRLDRRRQPALGQRDRVQAAGELAQLGVGGGQLRLGELEQRLRRLGLASARPEQVRDREQPLLRAVVQVAPDAAALGVGRLDHAGARRPQRRRLCAPLELRAGARGEDPQDGDVLGLGLHALRVEHGEVAEVGVLRVAQAHREVALEPHLDRAPVLGEVLHQALGEGDERLARDERARLAGRVVLERLLDRRAVVPARDDLDVRCRRGRSPRRRAPAWRRAPRRRCARAGAGTRRRPRRRCPRRRPAGARGHGGVSR